MEITRPYSNEIILVKDFASKDDMKIVSEYVESLFLAAETGNRDLIASHHKEKTELLMDSLDKLAQEIVLKECRLRAEPEFSTLKSFLRYDNEGMDAHYDDLEGSHQKPVMYGCILYVNDNFDGGELYYENLGIVYDPVPGQLIIHPGTKEYTHGVNKATNGSRITASMFVLEK